MGFLLGKRQGSSFKLSLLVMVVLPTMLCGNSNNPTKNADGVSVAPPSVLRMVDASPPVENEVHVQRRGQLAVGSETPFCAIDPDVAPDLRKNGIKGTGLVGLSELLQKWELPVNVDGSHRQRPADAKICPRSGNPIMSKGYALLNRGGKPYRLVMAFWQGEAVWVGTIERTGEGAEPEVFNPYGLDPLPLQVASDTEFLSRKFLSSIVRK